MMYSTWPPPWSDQLMAIPHPLDRTKASEEEASTEE